MASYIASVRGVLNLEQTNQFFPNLAIFLLQEFQDVFPEEMLSEHQIDFVPEAIIPNYLAYKSNPRR